MRHRKLRAVYFIIRSVCRLHPLDFFRFSLSFFISGSYALRLPGYSHALLIRGGTTDPYLFFNIFFRQEYPILEDEKPEYIVDAGANAGYSAIFFNHCYPEASIFAIEPHPVNFELLCSNTKHVDCIERVQMGVWSGEGKLCIQNPDHNVWGYQYKKSAQGEVDAISMKKCIERYTGGGKILVKMDIEGAERDIFLDDCLWLERVDYLWIEVHGCRDVVFDALSDYCYELRQSGENLCIRFNHAMRDPDVGQG